MLEGQVTNQLWPNGMTSENNNVDWMYKPLIPVIYIQTMLQIAEERGLNSQDLIRNVGLSEATLHDPLAIVPPIVHACLVALIVDRTGNHGLGVDIGLRLTPTAHGSLGIALLCCRTLREAMTLAERFWYLRERTVQCRFSEHDNVGIISLHTDVSYPDQFRAIHFDGLVAMFYRIIQILLCDTQVKGEIWLDYPEPDYYQQYRDQLPPIRYEMPLAQCRFPAEILDRPLLMSNPEALKQCIEQCERERLLLGDSASDFLSRVLDHMTLSHGHYASQSEVADKLHMTVRTLRRRLLTHGTSYLQLLENTQKNDALRLLDNASLDIKTIAELMGYINPANFTRAFRKWMGTTPSEYRALIKQPDSNETYPHALT
jgi:AraC-like DNA-binding protein